MTVRVLITRPRESAEDFALKLREIGAQPLLFPTIEIRPVEDTSELDSALSKLENYEWLVLTSANAVKVIVGRMDALEIATLPPALRIAAVGPKTAGRLTKAGIEPDFVPDEFLAEAILSGMGELRDRWVLLPTADIAHDTLPKAIQDCGGVAHVITAYHTVPAHPDPQGLEEVRRGVDLITFTSGSSARNFHTLIQRAGLDVFNLPGAPKVACIGPKTAATAEELGFEVEITPQNYTVDSLVQAIGQNNRDDS